MLTHPYVCVIETMIPESLSQRINATRFVMILAVILIHCNILFFIDNKADAPISVAIIELFSVYLPAVGVPFFFFISGYLLQTKHPSITLHSFYKLIVKRCKTILLPYLLWNTIAILFWIFINITPLNRYTGGGPEFDSFLGMLYYMYWRPALIPLWFLRNLMGFIILVPLLQKILKYSPILFVVSGFFIETYTSLGGIFYFVSGMALAHWWQPARFEKNISRLSVLAILYCLIKIFMVVSSGDIGDYPLIEDSVNIMGLVGFMALCSKPMPLFRHLDISGAVFFVYAFHGIISPYVIKGLLLVYDWQGELWMVDYIASFVITTCVSFGAYYFFSRYCPRLCAIMTGNR